MYLAFFITKTLYLYIILVLVLFFLRFIKNNILYVFSQNCGKKVDKSEICFIEFESKSI